MSGATCFVPDPCTLLNTPPFACSFKWCVERNRPITYNALYSTGYVVATAVPKMVDGIPTMIQNDLESWLFRIALIQTVPYVATFIVLFIVLMVTKVILFEVGIMLILLIILLTIICILWMLQDSSNVISTLETNISSKLNENWNNNPQFSTELSDALFNPDSIACYCKLGQSEEQQAIDQDLLESYRAYGSNVDDINSDEYTDESSD